MGVYIRGMEMPTRCGRCDFHIPAFDDCMFDHYECCITAARIDNLGEKMEDCPLVPVQPHGRLIEEADAIETAWMILRGLGYRKEENPQLEQTVREVFATAPTIEVE